MQQDLIIATQGPGLYEFTRDVADFARDDGLMTVFVRHTSCSILIQENADPAVQVDLLNWLKRFVPHADDQSLNYLIHRDEGPDDMPAHLKAAVLPVSLSVPVRDGRLMLGTWQGIYLFEHRDRPHRRHVVLHQSD